MFEREAKYQLVFFIGPAILGAWAGLWLPIFGLFGLLAVSIAAIGFGFLLSAKLSEKKRTKTLVSWGSKGMNFKEKTSYFIGFIMILSYFVLSIILALHPMFDNPQNL